MSISLAADNANDYDDWLRTLQVGCVCGFVVLRTICCSSAHARTLIARTCPHMYTLVHRTCATHSRSRSTRTKVAQRHPRATMLAPNDSTDSTSQRQPLTRRLTMCRTALVQLHNPPPAVALLRCLVLLTPRWPRHSVPAAAQVRISPCFHPDGCVSGLGAAACLCVCVCVCARACVCVVVVLALPVLTLPSLVQPLNARPQPQPLPRQPRWMHVHQPLPHPHPHPHLGPTQALLPRHQLPG